MSSEFALPVAVSIAPRRWIIAAIIALHCLPLPALLFVGDALPISVASVAWALAALAALSLAVELHKQHLAGAATRLEGNAVNNWLLHREAGQPGKVQLIDAADCRWFVLLLVAQDGRKFRLLVRSSAQTREQLHRLKVLRAMLDAG